MNTSEGRPGEEAPDGRTKRASQKRKDRRNAILRAARRVFAEKGYHHTHISDVIAAANIARGTFYLYFESKKAVFLELLDLLMEELRESIVGVDTDDGAPPVQTQLVDTVEKILKTVVDNSALTRILVREAVGLDEDVDVRLRAFYANLLDYIRGSLENGQRLGILRGDLDTEVAAFCVLGTIKQFMEQLVMREEIPRLNENVRKLSLAVLDFNLRGLLRTN